MIQRENYQPEMNANKREYCLNEFQTRDVYQQLNQIQTS